MTVGAPDGPTRWHTLDTARVVAQHDTDLECGLDAAEVERRRALLGENVLPRADPPSVLRRFFEQLLDPLVVALLLAATVAGTVAYVQDHGHQGWLRYSDTGAILLIVLLNALLGLFQEGQARRALEALEKMTTQACNVLREGRRMTVSTRELVPGDVVQLETGDAIPADLKLHEVREAFTQEASLTGESTSVSKDADAVLPAETPLAERANMAYLGTTLVQGTARGVVVETGIRTELGRIGSLMATQEAGVAPLQERLKAFGNRVLVACLVVSAGLFLHGLARGLRPWTELLLTSVSLAVAAIPEGLPAITTITLALGMQRMAARGAVIRRLRSVETLGSATVICSDKTGTLTCNAMTIRELWTPDEAFTVTGEGFSPEGSILAGGEPVEELPAGVRHLIEVGVLCNTAALEELPDGTRRVLGDPTEAAFLVLAEKAGMRLEKVAEAHPILEAHPFDSERQRMSVRTDEAGRHQEARVKGSPEGILPLCRYVERPGGPLELPDEPRARYAEVAAAMAGRGLRVLALGYRSDPDGDDELDLTLLGFVGMIDPPREGVREAIAACHRAGIRVVMITGDHPRTARAIAEELGFWVEGAVAWEGREVAAMDDAALSQAVAHAAVFARVSPTDKLRILEALKARGEVAAMTGDGVNDAPALRSAQMGVAMGLGGTDVAREAADMILLDDNFATIVKAIREGRTVYSNIQKSLYFLLSANAGLVVAVIGGDFFPAMLPLAPLQLLWINLVTNGLPALALGVDPISPRIMDYPPKAPEAPLMEAGHMRGIAWQGVFMGLSALALASLPTLAPELAAAGGRPPEHVARTMAFGYLALAPLLHAFSCRTRVRSLTSLNLLSNRYLLAAVAVSGGLQLLAMQVPLLRSVFHTVPLTGSQWLLVLVTTVLVLPAEELRKWLEGRREPQREGTHGRGGAGPG